VIHDIDVALSELVVDLRWPPLTAVMLLASAWWVKAFAFVTVAARGDLRARRLPWRAAVTAVAVAVTPYVYGPLKQAIGRPRPFAQGLWDALGPMPASFSMPSGHAMTAVAGATAVWLLYPAGRWSVAGLATLICLSRVYLGVHFASDVIVGALIGALLAVVAVRAAEFLVRAARPARSGR
jgi:membrane-associated phospholipid phosphatase